MTINSVAYLDTVRRSFKLGSAKDDRCKSPGYVSDDVWCHVNTNRAAEKLRQYIGGGGFGKGDPDFSALVASTYSSSNIDEIRRPAKLRERLTATEGPVFPSEFMDNKTTT